MLSFQLSQLKDEIFNFVLKTFDFTILSPDLITDFFNIEFQNNNTSLSEFNFILLNSVFLVDLGSQFFRNLFILLLSFL